MNVYLAGYIPKGLEEESRTQDWRSRYVQAFAGMEGIHFISPVNPGRDEQDYLAIFGKNCHHIQESDAIIVYGEGPITTGTSQEMMIAKHFGKLVITILPKNSHARKQNLDFGHQVVDDWIHPFVHSTSDLIYESIEECALDFKTIKKTPPKGMEIIEEAIEYWKGLDQ